MRAPRSIWRCVALYVLQPVEFHTRIFADLTNVRIMQMYMKKADIGMRWRIKRGLAMKVVRVAPALHRVGLPRRVPEFDFPWNRERVPQAEGRFRRPSFIERLLHGHAGNGHTEVQQLGKIIRYETPMG